MPSGVAFPYLHLSQGQGHPQTVPTSHAKRNLLSSLFSFSRHESIRVEARWRQLPRFVGPSTILKKIQACSRVDRWCKYKHACMHLCIQRISVILWVRLLLGCSSGLWLGFSRHNVNQTVFPTNLRTAINGIHVCVSTVKSQVFFTCDCEYLIVHNCLANVT